MIDYDQDMDRHYITLPGGFEVQTKGRGSSFRIYSQTEDHRYLVADDHIHAPIEAMARAAHDEVERLRELLRYIRHESLVYWKPDTARDELVRADAYARIESALAPSNCTGEE